MDWTFFNGIVTERFSQSNSSWLGGGQVGYLHGNWVAGIEVSYSATDLKHTSSALLAFDRSRNSNIDDLLLVTARFGYASDRWLAYLKGGYANAQMGFDTIVTSTGAPTTTSSRRDGGWTVGAGWEFAITQGLSFAVEYDFARIEVGDRSQLVFPGFIVPETITNSHADIQAVNGTPELEVASGSRSRLAPTGIRAPICERAATPLRVAV